MLFKFIISVYISIVNIVNISDIYTKILSIINKAQGVDSIPTPCDYIHLIQHVCSLSLQTVVHNLTYINVNLYKFKKYYKSKFSIGNEFISFFSTDVSWFETKKLY